MVSSVRCSCFIEWDWHAVQVKLWLWVLVTDWSPHYALFHNWYTLRSQLAMAHGNSKKIRIWDFLVLLPGQELKRLWYNWNKNPITRTMTPYFLWLFSTKYSSVSCRLPQVVNQHSTAGGVGERVSIFITRGGKNTRYRFNLYADQLIVNAFWITRTWF